MMTDEEKGKKEKKEERERKVKRGIKIAFIVGLLDVAVLFVEAIVPGDQITCALASVGAITFLGILMLVNSLSDSENVDKGEMRKAIAGSLVVLYLALLSLLSFRKSCSANTEVAKTIIQHFTTLVEIVVIFYFGSRVVEKYTEHLTTKAELEKGAQPKEPVGE